MKKIICLMCATALLSSCHIYKSYDRPEDITTAGLYRDTASVNDTLAADTANFGNLPWREVFTDPQLQTLIEQALTNNGDLRSAALNVKQACRSYYLFPFRTLSGSVLWIYVEFAGWFCTLFVASTVLQMVVERT